MWRRCTCVCVYMCVCVCICVFMADSAICLVSYACSAQVLGKGTFQPTSTTYRHILLWYIRTDTAWLKVVGPSYFALVRNSEEVERIHPRISRSRSRTVYGCTPDTGLYVAGWSVVDLCNVVRLDGDTVTLRGKYNFV